MTVDGRASARRKAKRLRIAAMIILLLGAAGVNAVLWLGTANDPNNLAMVDYEKSQAYQAERMYGTQGAVLEKALALLKRPAAQAAIIGLIAASAAGCCWRVGMSYAREAESEGES